MSEQDRTNEALTQFLIHSLGDMNPMLPGRKVPSSSDSGIHSKGDGNNKTSSKKKFKKKQRMKKIHSSKFNVKK